MGLTDSNTQCNQYTWVSQTQTSNAFGTHGSHRPKRLTHSHLMKTFKKLTSGFKSRCQIPCTTMHFKSSCQNSCLEVL